MNYGKLALKRLDELAESVYGAEESPSYTADKRLYLQVARKSAVSEFSRQIRFKTASVGSVTVGVNMTVTKSVKLQIFLDGERVKQMSYSTYNTTAECICAGVPAGNHVAEVCVTGSSFNLNSFGMYVSGGVLIADDDVFVEGFPGDMGYLVLNLGRLEVYSLTATVSTLVATYYGVKDARAVGDAIALVTETGEACIMTAALSSSPGFKQITSGADSVGAAISDSGDMLVFVSKRGVIEVYRHLSEQNLAIKIGEAKGEFTSSSARIINGRIYMANRRSGAVELVECEKTVDYSPADCFTVSVKREVL